MAPMFKDNRSVFGGVAVITLLVIITVIGFAAFLNNRCQRAFWDDQIIYPGAEKVEEEAAFLGVQRVVYRSPDAPEVVEAWYTEEIRVQRSSQMREAVESGDFRNVETFLNWQIEPDTQGGSILTLAGNCIGNPVL